MRKVGQSNIQTHNEDSDCKNLNEKKVSMQIASEYKKASCDTTLLDEYTEKMLLYGYVCVSEIYK
jgi:hypothetical protein